MEPPTDLPEEPRRRFPRRLRPDSAHPNGVPNGVPSAPFPAPSTLPPLSERTPISTPQPPAPAPEAASAPPDAAPPISVAVEPEQPSTSSLRFPSLAKLLRRTNRVRDMTTAEQNEFAGKRGVAPGDVQAHASASPDAQSPPLTLEYLLKEYVLDASTDAYYYWTVIVSIAYVYNLVVVIARVVFIQLSEDVFRYVWFFLDILTDITYLIDMFARTRTGFLEQGLLVRDISKIRRLYFKSRQFKFDIFSIIPLDYVVNIVSIVLDYTAGKNGKRYIGLNVHAVFRLNRLFRVSRIQDCMERTETRSSMPNAFRVCCVVWYIVAIIHWNACFYFLISEIIGLGSDSWVYGKQNKQSIPDGVEDTLLRRYIYSFYWSTLTLTTIGEVPGPVQNVEYVFVTLDLMCGVLIFATIVGNVGSMISNMSAARTEFQNRMDGIKQYMELRKVSKQLEMRVIKWFDYLWANKESLSDQQVLKVLPDKLQAEIAMHVHFETLRKVRIFQDCEAGLLAELVLKLQLQVFSPGDYICRKGDIGREMYIVKRGRLQVVKDDGTTVLATLQEGAVFGELSILNIAGSKNGNRRTANVRSVGYTDLFVLNKNDLWSALKEYPDARKLLLAKGRELLRKDNLLDENAPQEQMTAEEMAEQLHSSVKTLQTRLARLIAEHTSTESKLKTRVEFLERQLQRYRRKRTEGAEETMTTGAA